MWSLLSNPLVSHALVALIAGGGAWWAAVKTKVAALEASAHAELVTLIADARADFATASGAVKAAATTVAADINKAV